MSIIRPTLVQVVRATGLGRALPWGGDQPVDKRPTVLALTAGYTERWRADVGVTKNGSDRVSDWAGELGKSWQQPSGANQTLWKATGLASRPSIYFNGSNTHFDRLSASIDFSATKRVTTQYVFRVENIITTNKGVFAFRDATKGFQSLVGVGGPCYSTGKNGSNFNYGSQTVAAATNYVATCFVDSTAAAAAQTSVLINNAGTTTRGDNTSLASMDMPVAGAATSFLGVVDANFYQGELAELVVYPFTLNAGQLAANHAYFASRYGLA